MLPKGAIANYLGQMLGSLITYNIFLPLSSLNFLNTFIFNHNPVKTTVFTYENMVWFMILFYIITLVYIMLCVSERDPNYNKETDSIDTSKINICAVFKAFPKFFTNKDTLRITLYFIIKYIGTCMISGVYSMVFTKNGFPPYQTALLSTLTMPIIFLICFLSGRFLKRGSNQRMSQYMFIFYIAAMIGNYFV